MLGTAKEPFQPCPNSRGLVDRFTLSGDISELCLRSRDADQRLTVEIK
jgi:hypothetical protein